MRYASSDVVVIDTETTGTNPTRDEVLSVAIVDGSGKELFYSLIHPAKRKRWESAERINHISPDDVKDAPLLLEVAEKIEPILNKASIIVGYNVDFDITALQAGGVSIPNTTRFDVMRTFAPIYGEWAEWKHDWKWQRLEICASHYGYRFNAHNALEDAKATAFCYWKVLDDIDRINKASQDSARKKRDAEKTRARNLFIACLFGGWLGIHKFMQGKIGEGFAYLITLGLFLIGWISDSVKLGKYYLSLK